VGLQFGRDGRGRFIPTPVGNTRARPMRSAAMAVHPHARGEHAMTMSPSDRPNGSSPRPWGTLQPAAGQRACRRFIPTPVGNTARSGRAACWLTVHPHARGEHVTIRLHSFYAGGSSPRPWGTLQAAQAQAQVVRFIPTPVGNTRRRPCAPPARSVHPHARGEHLAEVGQVDAEVGSSPRPWGTRS